MFFPSLDHSILRQTASLLLILLELSLVISIPLNRWVVVENRGAMIFVVVASHPVIFGMEIGKRVARINLRRFRG